MIVLHLMLFPICSEDLSNVSHYLPQLPPNPHPTHTRHICTPRILSLVHFIHLIYTFSLGDFIYPKFQLLLLCHNTQSSASASIFFFFYSDPWFQPNIRHVPLPRCLARISNFIYWKINSLSSSLLQLFLLLEFSILVNIFQSRNLSLLTTHSLLSPITKLTQWPSIILQKYLASSSPSVLLHSSEPSQSRLDYYNRSP